MTQSDGDYRNLSANSFSEYFLLLERSNLGPQQTNLKVQMLWDNLGYLETDVF